ncbi:MAG: hypothetical protein IKU36_11485 [Bacteroidales bacterium]|nr:hypothetical protein [Bacteroidales bacterium]
MKTLFKLFALCALTFSLSSCATIFTATKYPVSFTTNPEGASVKIENRAGKVVFEGTTPTVVKLKSSAGYMQKEEYTITFAKDGYVQKTVHISAELDGWYIGNLLLGGLPGMLIIDPLSGAMYKIADEDQDVRETLAPVSGDVALQVYDINNLPSGISKDDLVCLN